MKQSDIAVLILVVAISLMMSWFIFGAIIPENEGQEFEVEVIEPISAEFPPPDNDIFQDGYLNPTELILIDESDNQTPFSQ